MKQTLKKMLVTVALISAAVTVNAQIVSTGLSGGTNNIAATATNTYTGVTFALPSNARTVSLEATAALQGAGTSAMTFAVSKSVSGIAYVAVTNVVVTANGTNTVNAVVDIDPAGARFWKVTTGANLNATAATNVTFTVGVGKAA